MYWGLGVPVDRIGVVMGVSQDGSINGGPGLWNSLLCPAPGRELRHMGLGVLTHHQGSSSHW